MAEKSSERYSIPVPKFSLKNNSYIPLLIALLLVASFFLGRLSFQVEYLQKGASSATPTTGDQAALPPAEEPKADSPQLDKEHLRGNKNAKLTLVEYVDLECPFCKQFHPTVKQVLDTYGDKVNLVFRHYPLTAIHPNAQKAGEAAECVAQLSGEDKFWEYVDKIFESPTALTTSSLAPFAAEIGINQTQFQSCLDSGKHAQKVSENLNKVSIGTPATFIFNNNGDQVKFLSGAMPFESMKAEIDSLLK